jgi:hypothetical protein
MMEEIVCSYQLKSLRDQAASGQYVRPQILQFTPTELAGCVDLSLKQKAALEEHWQQFVSDIKSARAFLGEHTTQAANGMVAAMEAGEYNPSSSKAAAEVRLIECTPTTTTERIGYTFSFVFNNCSVSY